MDELVYVPQFTVGEVIACLDREVRLRRHIYPKWVKARKLSQEKADDEIAKMQQALDWLRAAEEKHDQQQRPKQEVLL